MDTRFTTVKAPVIDTIRNPVIKEILLNYVRDVNNTTTAAYALCKYMFLNVYNEQPGPDHVPLFELANREFFKQVWLNLTARRGYNRIQERTARFRAVINRFLPEFMDASGYELLPFANSGQTSEYEATRMEAAYLNMLSNNFGNVFRNTINKIIDLKGRKDELWNTMKTAGVEEQDIKAMVREQLTLPASRLKNVLSTGDRPMFLRGDYGVFNVHRDAHLFDFFFNSYTTFANPNVAVNPTQYGFMENSVYYDVKVNPAAHLKAYMNMARVGQELSEDGRAPFQSCPLRSPKYPLYTQMDTSILGTKILGMPANLINAFLGTNELKRSQWNIVFNLDHQAFKQQHFQTAQGRQTLEFRGTVFTDGVGISILKSSRDTRAGRGRRTAARPDEREFSYITEAIRNAETRPLLMNNCLVIDPNRRDLLFGVHEDSTVDHPIKIRFTRSTRSVKSGRKRARDIHLQLIRENQNVQDATEALSANSRKSMDLEEYVRYLAAQYGEHGTTLRNFYSNTQTQNNHEPLYRWLKLKITLKENAMYQKLSNELKAFSPVDLGPPTLIMGDWSAPNARFHEPIPGVMMKRKLKSLGHNIFLIDEYLSSSLCPTCEQRSMERFCHVLNP